MTPSHETEHLNANTLREGLALHGLRSLKEQLERIASKPTSDQPSYADGVRPFGTGDLRYFVEALSVAIAALQHPSQQAGMEGVIASMITEEFAHGGGCVEGPDWSWDSAEADRLAKALSARILAALKQAQP